MVHFLTWIIVGALIGWVTSIIMKTNNRQGFFFVLGTPVSAYGHFSKPSDPHSIFAFVEALIAVGLIIAGRLSMSKKAS